VKFNIYGDIQSLGQSGLNVGAAIAFGVSNVPIPSAVWLFGSGLLGLLGVTRRKKS